MLQRGEKIGTEVLSQPRPNGPCNPRELTHSYEDNPHQKCPREMHQLSRIAMAASERVVRF